MKHHIGYTQSDLDRAGHRRKDASWLSEQLQNPLSHIIPLWRNLNLVAGLAEDDAQANGPEAVIYDRREAESLVEMSVEVVFLGVRRDRAVFGVDVSVYDEQAVHQMCDRGTFVDLRQAGPVINASDATLMAYARGVMYWHRQHQFCGRCGEPTRSMDGGHMRVCSDVGCAHPTFPRTDPAVIMLVENRPKPGDPPKCLLGNHAKWAIGNFSTLAGFVEPGETLEEAVIREVLEEVGVTVTDVRYQASQPWPFPASIMLGFKATAMSMDIRIDNDEIQDARWFTAAEIRQFGAWGDMDQTFRLPRTDSISRNLIESWLDEVTG